MEKSVQCSLAEKYGLRTPYTEEVIVGNTPKVVTYPIITKASNSLLANWKSVVHICNNEKELFDVYQSINEKSIILQEYIHKKNEYILQGISIRGGDELFIPLEGRYYRLPEDAYGTYLYFQRFNSADSWKIMDSLQKMFKEIGYSGVFEVEFIEAENGTLYFLEINFRHTLWNYTFTKMGVNLATLWYESEHEGHIKTDVHIKKEPFKLIREFTDYSYFVKTGKISVWRWIKDVISADSHVVFDFKDIKPYIMLIKEKLL